MSNEREELLKVLLDADEAHAPEGSMWPELAEAILAAGYRKPRTITTAEELDALPDGAAVLDRHGDVSTKHAHWWHGYETSPLPSRKVAKYGPLTVLWESK